jgi:CheY-like chemotaxis protein
MDVEYYAERGQTRRWMSADGDKGTGRLERGGSPPSARDAIRPSPAAGPASKGRILIVDDDLSVRETLADLLEVEGYNPLQAGDAVEALMILRAEAVIDALVTDLTMPGADGISLIRHARELKCDLPAILLTGYAEEMTSVATIAGGNFHVLRKPVESERLIEQLELLVSRSSKP